jgi:hypothetical protein
MAFNGQSHGYLFVGFMEGEGTFRSCHIISLTNDYMENPKFKSIYLPSLHDDELLLRTTLFEVGRGEMMQP